MGPTTELQGYVESWGIEEEPSIPYSATPAQTDVEQQVRADVRIAGRLVPVKVWYTPYSEEWTYHKYVIRAPMEDRQKSLNVYDSPDGLFVKNRATPWAEEKNWTYLTPDQLAKRSQIAGLGDVIQDEEGDGGYGLLLDLEDQPLVTKGSLAEDFVVTLTKALLVMKASENPAT